VNQQQKPGDPPGQAEGGSCQFCSAGCQTGCKDACSAGCEQSCDSGCSGVMQW
jgi:hypothetical protein